MFYRIFRNLDDYEHQRRLTRHQEQRRPMMEANRGFWIADR